MIRHLLVSLILFVAPTATVVAATPPSEVLDQINAVPQGGNGGLVIDSGFSEAQTFTVGVSGSLSRVELGVFKAGADAGPLTVDIIRVLNSQPSFAVADRLASQTLSFDGGGIPFNAPLSQPAFTLSVDFSAADLQFNAGDQVGIALRSDSPPYGGYTVWQTTSSLYAGGHASSLRLSDNLLITHYDTQFATYMLTVPEPQTIGLVALAGFILGGRRARQTGTWR
jgi:hypothetical protein